MPIAVVVVTGLLISVVYAQVEAGLSVEIVRVLAPMVPAGIAVLGMSGGRFERQGPWGLVAASMFCVVLAHVAWAVLYFDGQSTYPGIVDLFHLMGAVGMVGAVALFARGTQSNEDSLAPIDTLIVTIAVGLGVWLIVVEPYIASGSLPGGEQVWVIGVPLMGSVALAIAMRTAMELRFRDLGSMLVLFGVGLRLVADTSRYLLEPRGEFLPSSFAAALGVIGPMMLAAAAVAGETRHGRDELASQRMLIATFGRVVGLSVAVLMPLTVVLALTVAGVGSTATRIVAAASGLVVVALALTRMWGLVATVRGMTERKGQDRLTAIVEHSTDVVVLLDRDGLVRYASPSMQTALSHRSADWIGRPILDLVASGDRTAALDQIDETFRLGVGGTTQFEVTLVRADGSPRRVATTMVNQVGGEAVDGIVVTFRDITDERDLQDELSRKAYFDELTGLANRALFLDKVDVALRTRASYESPVAVLFVDLDDFKSVNDALGHAAGDQLLCNIADRVRAQVTGGDTPARLGGDEFAVLLEASGGVERGVEIGEALLDSLREPMDIAGYDVVAMASVGVAVAAPSMTTSELLRDADIAMYEAKRSGKGQVKIFDPAMRLGATQHLTMRSALAEGIANGELRPAFQPMIDMRTGAVVGAEALARWHHPEKGVVPPSEFIPIAERSGLIGELGEAILDQAIRACATWQADAERFVSVNVSAAQLKNESFVELVADRLAHHGLPPQCLWLEVTETMLVEEIEATSEMLQRLRELGVLVAIDDFGTGYCSLSYLQKFPVDVLKIDRQFVNELDGSPKGSSLAKMILQMTAALEITSVGEGIEEKSQLRALRNLGCDIGQGFLLSRPMEAEDLAHRLGVAPGDTPPVRAAS